MKKILIKAGFELKITSWENNGVCYDTVSTTGLTEIQVRFLLNIAHFFSLKAKDNFFVGGKNNNEKELFELLLKENKNWIEHPQYKEIKKLLPQDEKNIHIWFYKYILSKPCLNEYGYCRVFSDFQIFYHNREQRIIVEQ